MTIVRALPKTYRGSILIVVHTRNDGDSFLAQILGRVTPLPVRFAIDGEQLEAGTILVAPPDFHLLVRASAIELNRGPRENGFRPAVDPLFRTASRVYGSRVMGIVLSGALDDGTYGMKVVQDGGGTTVIQDPNEATVPSMPLNVLRTIDVDHVLRASAIAELIVRAADSRSQGEPAMARPKEPEPQNLRGETEVEEMLEDFGPPSGLTCPDCGGSLWEIEDGKLVRYRCHVGHQFTPDGLDSEQSDAVEGALWSAVRVLEEHADLRRRMARRAQAAGLNHVSSGFEKSADETHRQAHSIRGLLFGRDVAAPMQAAVEKNGGERDDRAERRPAMSIKRGKQDGRATSNGRATKKRGKKPR
jgi:two-component system, chemotaxis family, protein-glutamate methylesterase/glutaminase